MYNDKSLSFYFSCISVLRCLAFSVASEVYVTAIKNHVFFLNQHFKIMIYCSTTVCIKLEKYNSTIPRLLEYMFLPPMNSGTRKIRVDS